MVSLPVVLDFARDQKWRVVVSTIEKKTYANANAKPPPLASTSHGVKFCTGRNIAVASHECKNY